MDKPAVHHAITKGNTVKTIEQAKSAAKRMHAVLKDHHNARASDHAPKLSAAQSLLAHGLGYKDWHALEKAIAADGGDIDVRHAAAMSALQKALEGDGHDHAEHLAVALRDAMLESGTGANSPDDALRLARPSGTLLYAMHGRFPGLGGELASKRPRAGAGKIEGMPVMADVRKSWETPEDLGLRVIDGAWHLSDAEGIAAIVQGVAYVPEWELDDSEAVLAADAESDGDADTVSAIVEAQPDIFFDGDAVFHVRALEVRPDLRGKGIARQLVAAAVKDIEARRSTNILTLSYDPDNLLEGTPAMRSRPAVAEALPDLVATIMERIAQSANRDALRTGVERTTHEQNIMRIGHLVSGGAVGAHQRLTGEQAELRMMRAQNSMTTRVNETMGAAWGVIASEDYPDGRHTEFHRMPNIVIDPPADLLDHLGKGAIRLEIVTAPKRLNQVVNYTDEPGLYRIVYDDGEVTEIENHKLEQGMSMRSAMSGDKSAVRAAVAAANLRLAVRSARPKENDRDADIVHRRVLTRDGITEEVDPPIAAATAVIAAVEALVDDEEMDRRYQALANSIRSEGMLVNQQDAMAEVNGGMTIPWTEIKVMGGRRFDIEKATLLDLFGVPLSPTIERFYAVDFPRHEAMNNRIIEVAKNYLLEILDGALATGVGGGITREQLALDIRFVRAWRSLTRDMLATRIRRPLGRIAEVR